MDPQFTSKFQVPEEMRDFAEKSVDQARKAFDGFIGAAQKAVDTVEGSTQTVRSNAQDMTRRTLSFAEQNMKAAFDHAQKLVRAKDMQDAMQIQSEFVKTQFGVMQQQMREFGAGVQKTATEATEAVKPKV